MSSQSDWDEERRKLREKMQLQREEQRQLRDQIRLEREEIKRQVREQKEAHRQAIHQLHEERKQKPSYRDVERQRREQDILQCASKLLVERGYADLNMDDLAEEVGISKPTLYQHFRSKEELARRVVVKSYETMEAEISALMSGTPLERMTQIMRHILKSKYAAGGLTAVMDNATFASLARSSPAIQERQARAKQGLTYLVEQAKAQGQIPTTLPTPLIVRHFFSLQNLLNDVWCREELAALENAANAENGQSNNLSEKNLDEAIEAVVQMFLHGVSQPTDQRTDQATEPKE